MVVSIYFPLTPFDTHRFYSQYFDCCLKKNPLGQCFSLPSFLLYPSQSLEHVMGNFCFLCVLKFPHPLPFVLVLTILGYHRMLSSIFSIEKSEHGLRYLRKSENIKKPRELKPRVVPAVTVKKKSHFWTLNGTGKHGIPTIKYIGI